MTCVLTAADFSSLLLEEVQDGKQEYLGGARDEIYNQEVKQGVKMLMRVEASKHTPTVCHLTTLLIKNGILLQTGLQCQSHIHFSQRYFLCDSEAFTAQTGPI